MSRNPVILITDGQRESRATLKARLASLPAETIEAGTGASAIELAFSTPNLAMILLDIPSLGIEGCEITEQLRSHKTTRHIPIVFITAHPPSDLAQRDDACGAVDYLQKPVNHHVLLSKARFFLDLWEMRMHLEQEIERRNQAESTIQYLANHDQLTSLPNRRQLDKTLAHEILRCDRYGKKMALLFLDLDGFKRINDTLGHHVGDQVLLKISERFRELIRETDTLARFGGDEFVILMTDIAEKDPLVSRLKRILETTLAPVKIGDNLLNVGVSIGVAYYPDHAGTADELLSCADKAMYQAKSEGKNTFRFYSLAMNQAVKKRLEMEEQLYTALERNEFSLVYQPIIDIQHNRVIGAEALLRWHNEKLGQVPPDEFIPVLEEIGLICNVGHWVLNQACEQIRQWRLQHDVDLRICINVSSLQFIDPAKRLLGDIRSLIDRKIVAAKNIEIEITEGLLLHDGQSVNEQLHALKALQVDIAIDDFGTGFASLNYLKKYPITTLKIDRSFVSDIPGNAESCILVNAILAMSHGLGIKVIAEGIENPAQLNYLSHLACHYGQGYLFSRPLPADDFIAFVEAANKAEITSIQTPALGRP